MSNPTNLPVEDMIREAARSIEPRPDFSETLWKQIESKPRTTQPDRRRTWMTRPVWTLASLALALALIAAAYGPDRVVAAFKTLIGYIPGVGFVQQDEGTKYLSKPITIEKNGVKLIVEQAVADSEKIVVAYHIDNLPAVPPGGTVVCVYSDNRLRLPNGKDSLPIGGGVSGTEARIQFAPLQADVNKVTLVVHGEKDCPAPQDWEVEIPLGKEAPQPALPVVEIQQTVTEVPPVALQSAETGQPDTIKLAVEKAVALPDGWLITGKVSWDQAGMQNVYPQPESAIVTDASGKDVPVSPSDEDVHDGEFALKLNQKDIQGPISLQYGNMMIFGMLENGPTFTFDAGANPQPGQKWDVNLTVEFLGEKVVIKTVEAVTLENNVHGYAGTMQLPQNAYNANLRAVEPKLKGGTFGQGMKDKKGLYRLEMGFPDGCPTGKVTLQLVDMQWSKSGSWKTEWNMGK